MLSKEQLQEIAKRAGIEGKTLQSAISSEKEEKLELPNVIHFTDDELTSLKENAKKEGYLQGKDAGVEMKFKELRDAFGIEGVEGKSMEKLIEKIKEKTLEEAKVEPNKKIEELNSDLQKLRNTLKQTEQEKDNSIQQLTKKMTQLEIESEIKNLLPDEAGGLSKDDLFLLYTGKRKINKTESGIELIDIKTGDVLKDKTQTNVKLLDDINSFLEGRKITPNGRGGKDEQRFSTTVENLKTRSEVETYFEKNNIPLAERSAILQKAMKNEGFDIKR